MALNITGGGELRVGTETSFPADSPQGRYAAVFEDDGETGYFYGLDEEREGNPIVDALHVYDVEKVVDADKPSQVDIAWSDDGTAVVLIINDYPHAAFDFAARRACCRSNFPPPDGRFTDTHEWSDDILERFR